MKGTGGAEVGHRRSARRIPRSTCRSCGRTAATSIGAMRHIHAGQRAGGRGSDVLQLVLRGRPDTDGGSGRESTSATAFVTRRHIRCSSTGLGNLTGVKDAGGAGLRGQVGDRADARSKAQRDVVRRRQQLRRVQGRPRTRTPLGRSIEFLADPKTQVALVHDLEPSCRRSRPGGMTRRVQATRTSRSSASSSRTRRLSRSIPTWSEIAAAINEKLEKMTDGRHDAGGGRRRDAAEGASRSGRAS